MYKRIYKKACEEIKGDRDAILDKAFERAAQPEKKKSPILKYSVIGTAAAAVIVAGAVILNWDVFKIPLDDMMSEDSATVIEDSQSEAAEETVGAEDEKAAAEIATEAAEESAEVTEEKEPATEKAAPSAAEKPTEKASQATPQETQPQTQESETEQTVPQEDAAETEESERATEFVVGRGRSMTNGTADLNEGVYEDATSGGAVTSSSSSAGGSGAKTEDAEPDEEIDDCDDDDDEDFDGGTMMLTSGWSGADVNAEALTYEEYINYLGFDVTGIELPEGMSFDWIEESVYEIYIDETGELADDVAMFTASGEGKSITIMTTRMIALDEEFEAYENVAANVARNGDYAIYAVKNGAYVTIEFDKVESEEIDAIAEQLAE